MCTDEIFGGYPWYRDEKIRAAYGFPWAQSTAYRSTFLNSEYTEKLNGFTFVNSRYEASLQNVDKCNCLNKEEARMREMVSLNMNWFMQTLLDRKDRMSMYNSLEVRVPYCDYRIAEYLYSTPWWMKDLEGREKGLLRTSMNEYLPEEVLWRKKSPYPKTHHPAYLESVSSILRDIVENADSPVLLLADRTVLKSLLTDSRSEPWYGQLMTIPQTIAYFIQMNYWMEKYQVEIKI